MKPLTRPITAAKTKNKGRLYCQCVLRNGNRVQVSHIPKQFAVEGDILKLRSGSEWEDGWLVESVGQEVDEAVLDGLRNALKHHADVSDM